MTRTIALTERRPRAVKLPRAEVDFLLGPARHLIDVSPTFERGTYTLTPRGYVGFFTGPAARYVIGPKIPWPNLQLLLGFGVHPNDGTTRPPEGGLLGTLATAFADQLEAVTRAGLVAGYSEVESVSPFLRGKLRTAAQMRDAASRAFPGHFHIDEPTFDLNTPWNRIARSAATALGTHPAVPRTTRERIETAARPLAEVPNVHGTDADFSAARAEPRAIRYHALLDLCAIIQQGFSVADPLRTGSGAFLLDLGQAFERYLFRSLRRELAERPGWSVDAHPAFALGPVTLRPDVLVRKRAVARGVLDAKWKTTALDPADLHQVLAYAGLTGAPRVGLVYPGRTDGRATFATPNGLVRVTRYRLRVVGTDRELTESAARLARHICRA
ncbi:McrC family protein [Gemmata sp. JC717]|uniref:McrC family protein n=1 Tax=Gemmata algarum TaxID=2975278 RepID=UPI0021BA6898|nr:McrC family protein [Gemmata algarum]MDY3551580.1 McrC family protein [Gemmata algarum]